MAFGRRTAEDSHSEPSTPPPPPSRGRDEGAGGLTAFIDQGSSFEGKLSFKDMVRIDGHFVGEISSENTLVIGETGQIEANVKSKTVIISGSLTGDVIASERVVLHKSARVEGNIESPGFSVESGAVFNGRMTMPGTETKAGKGSGSGGGGSSQSQGGQGGKPGNGKPSGS